MPTDPAAAKPDLIYFNGIDAETGQYAVPPVSLESIAQKIVERGQQSTQEDDRAMRAFPAPFGVDLTKLAETGWGIIFAEETPQEIRESFDPLIEHRRQQVGDLLQVLDYRAGEQLRQWYVRHHVSAGNAEFSAVPFYLLLVGSPTDIPFEFQYLLGVEYAMGRLALDSAEDYARYVASVIAYETAQSVENKKEITYWGTQHVGDPATNLSATLLIDPLANGRPNGQGRLRLPVHSRVNRVQYQRQLFAGNEALRQSLLDTLHQPKPPSLLFTASHGMSIPAGKPNQAAFNGGLLCQDWAGFGSIQRSDFLAAADIDDDANLGGLMAFFFACFSGGTPDVDQFLLDMSLAGHAPQIASQPFMAALPRRLLAHPRRSALAVVGHIDRAWGCSIQPDQMTEAQIAPFYDSLCYILNGDPVGYAISQQFGSRFAALGNALLAVLSPTGSAPHTLSDRDLVSLWIERNDAQNYVVLGDPAVRLRPDAMN